jgi:hypothetical protein
MTVQNFIATRDYPQREIMTILRSWIRDLGPHTTEKISHAVPTFSFYGQLCYLAPTTDSGVDLAFVKGYGIDDEDKFLESKGRKQIRSRTFYSVAELEEFEEPVRRLLNQAAILNEYQYKRKQKLKKNK